MWKIADGRRNISTLWVLFEKMGRKDSMRNFKKILLILFVALIVFVIWLSSNRKFTVKNNNADIKVGIEKFMNRGGQSQLHIDIKNNRDIDNIKIVSYTLSYGQFGYAMMKKTLGGSYKIITTSYGTNIIDVPIIETKEGKYLIAIGRKYNPKIKYFKTSVGDKNYIFDISGESYFIDSYQVSKNTNFVYGSGIIFIDEYNDDITKIVKIDD